MRARDGVPARQIIRVSKNLRVSTGRIRCEGFVAKSLPRTTQFGGREPESVGRVGCATTYGERDDYVTILFVDSRWRRPRRV